MDAPSTSSPTPASTTAAILRAAELEAQLALERAEHARRLREIEPKIQEFRATLGAVQQKLQRSQDESARLEARLADSAALAAELQRQLESARTNRTGNPGDLDAARAEIERLTGDLAQRDRSLADAATSLRNRERDVASLERKLSFAKSRIAELRDGLVAAKQSQETYRGSATQDDLVTPARREPRLPAFPGLRVEASLGPSGLGARFTAREDDGRRAVGVILFSRELTDTDTRRLEAMRRMQHENLVGVRAFGVSPSGPYVAFERAFGESAGEWVRRIGPLPERTAIPLAIQIARGLREAAFQGVTHGDLSPASIRIDPTGRARVEDVGLSSLSPESPPPVLAPLFASSERLRGSPPADERSDIYSLGAVLHFLLSGRAPYDGDAGQIARRQTSGETPDLRERNAAVSQATARLVLRMTAADPTRRPQTWDEVLVEIERIASGGAEAESPRSRRLADFVARHPVAATLVAAAPILCAAALLHVTTGRAPTMRQRFDDASARATRLAESGDVDAARLLLARFLDGTGDPAVEREAASRLDGLAPK